MLKYYKLQLMSTNDTNKSEVARREEEILKFWQDNKIFEKSLAKEAPQGKFVFYDGPPFATGWPHFGHLLPTSLKDAVPRYQTMRGFHVLRRWGWDCHGLPIENLIEKELGLETKKDIEKLGLAVFNQKARESVLRYAGEWEKTIPRLGRWVDMKNAYKTMDPSYTEAVWGVFKTIFDKGLVYEGYKAMHLCPRCGTALANFEVSQGYKDITDISVYVKFEILNPKSEKEYVLVWTTTPWTLPGNVALAINPNIKYVKVEKEGVNYYVAENLAEKVFKENYKVLETILGENLVGKKYRPVFDYYIKAGQIYGADFVTTEDGTGIVHIAPGFGEDDLNLGQKENLPFVQHVTTDGHFKPEVKDFAGLPVKPKDDPQSTDVLIIKYLAQSGALFEKQKITHSYPHCWRCDTPLLNYAASSWFVAVTKFREKLLAANQTINWIPEHIKDGRFGKWLEGARDWAVSRSRFWGAPLPVWRCEKCKKVTVIGSLKDLQARVKTSGNNYWIMRHGEAENNVKNIISSQTDNPHHLTEHGKTEVLNNVEKLKKAKLDLIVSSDFVRTTETTELLKKELNLTGKQVVFDERLREINFGDLDNRPIAEYHGYFASTLEKFTRSSPNGENLTQVKNRVTQCLYKLEEKYQGKNILLVSHETPLAMLAAGSRGFDLAATVKLKDGRDDFIKKGEVMNLPFKLLPHNENYELDFHRPYIDEIKLVCECDGEMRRVPEVFDVWFESGSMPYLPAQAGIQPDFPADFIAEGLDQTRGWFYVLLVLAVTLRGQSAYRRVVVNGLILAEDGQKMSKRLNNYPDVNLTIDKYGADALRFYLLSSPAVHADEFNFSEKGLEEVYRKIVSRLWNVYTFYETYVTAGHPMLNPPEADLTSDVLDRWIMARLNETTTLVTEAMERYELDQALRPLELFIDDLSTWYLRRSRERLKSDASVLRQVLLALAALMAPFTPFIAEDIYRKLKGEKESVHLEDWPTLQHSVLQENTECLAQMAQTRVTVSRGLELRAKSNIKTRQPLSVLTIDVELPKEYRDLIKAELNVEKIIFNPKLFSLDTNLTLELKEKGDLRDLIREIQDWRKAKGLKAGELAAVRVKQDKQALVKKYEAELKKATSASKIILE